MIKLIENKLLAIALLGILISGCSPTPIDDKKVDNTQIDQKTKAEQTFLLAQELVAGSERFVELERELLKLSAKDKEELAAKGKKESSFGALLGAKAPAAKLGTLLKDFLSALNPEQTLSQASAAQSALKKRPSNADLELVKTQISTVLLSHAPKLVNEIKDENNKFEAAAFNRVVSALGDVKAALSDLKDDNFESWLSWAIAHQDLSKAAWAKLYAQASEARKQSMRNRLLQAAYLGGDSELLKFFSELDAWGLKDGVPKDEYELKGTKGNLLLVVGKNIKKDETEASAPTMAGLSDIATIVRDIVRSSYEAYSKDLLSFLGADDAAKKLLGYASSPADVMGEALRLSPSEDKSSLELLYNQVITDAGSARALAQIQKDGQGFIDRLYKLYDRNLSQGIAADWLQKLGSDTKEIRFQTMLRYIADFKKHGDFELLFGRVATGEIRKADFDALVSFATTKNPALVEESYELLKKFVNFLREPTACKPSILELTFTVEGCQKARVEELFKLRKVIFNEFSKIQKISPDRIGADLEQGILLAYFLSANDPRFYRELEQMSALLDAGAGDILRNPTTGISLVPGGDNLAALFDAVHRIIKYSFGEKTTP